MRRDIELFARKHRDNRKRVHRLPDDLTPLPTATCVKRCADMENMTAAGLAKGCIRHVQPTFWRKDDFPRISIAAMIAGATVGVVLKPEGWNVSSTSLPSRHLVQAAQLSRTVIVLKSSRTNERTLYSLSETKMNSTFACMQSLP